MVGAVGEAGSCQGEPVSVAYWLKSSKAGTKSSKGFRIGESWLSVGESKNDGVAGSRWDEEDTDEPELVSGGV